MSRPLETAFPLASRTYRRMRVAAYTRVSTARQSLEPQRAQLRGFIAARAWDLVLEADDIASGAKWSRPGLTAILRAAERRRFDVLVVAACDRASRRAAHLIMLIENLQRAGIDFASVREGIDTTGPVGRAMLTIVGVFAELEHGFISQRVRDGLKSARAAGRIGGRPPLDAEIIADIRAREAGGQNASAIARAVDVSRVTVKKYLLGENQKADDDAGNN